MATEEAPTMVDFHVTGIPKSTERSVVQEIFDSYGGKLRFYKEKVNKPFAFVDIPEDKAAEADDAEFKIGEEVIAVSRAFKAIKYFLDSRETDGDLNSLTEEQLTTYFSQFGEVAEVKTVEEKGFGFLKMKKDPDNMEVETLAFNLHTIEGQVINVKESEVRRKRKRKGGKFRRNKRQNREN